IAVLRAEWAKLDAPLRLQGLAERHLPLKPLTATQYDSLKNLPERPPKLVKPGDPDPIGSMINAVASAADAPTVTGSVPQPEDRRGRAPRRPMRERRSRGISASSAACCTGAMSIARRRRAPVSALQSSPSRRSMR